MRWPHRTRFIYILPARRLLRQGPFLDYVTGRMRLAGIDVWGAGGNGLAVTMPSRGRADAVAREQQGARAASEGGESASGVPTHCVRIAAQQSGRCTVGGRPPSQAHSTGGRVPLNGAVGFGQSGVCATVVTGSGHRRRGPQHSQPHRQISRIRHTGIRLRRVDGGRAQQSAPAPRRARQRARPNTKGRRCACPLSI